MASYERQTWVDLQTPLDAAHMNHIEEGIASIVGITSIKQTTTSTADGGNNVITATLDNGTTETFNIKNGSKGSTGSKGDTGAAGVGIKSVVQTTTSSADGGNNVITVTKTDGTTSTFSVKNGSKGSAGAAGAKGADGYTPVKGVDYWTAADQESIVQQVIAALGTPVFGTIDEDNHITLTGKFVDGNYTFSIEDEEGKSYFDGSFSKQSYINQIPISTDASGNVYNGVGYKVGARCNSSGEIVDLTGGSNPPFCTGFIPCKQGDVIRLKNCYIHATTQDNDSFKALYGNTGPWGVRFGLYNSSKEKIAVESWGNLSQGKNATNILSDYTRVPEGTGLTQGMIYQCKIAYANTAYIRLCLAADVANGFTAADAIVTVNQEIG